MPGVPMQSHQDVPCQQACEQINAGGLEDCCCCWQQVGLGGLFLHIYIYIHSPYRILAAVHFLSCLSVLFSTFVRGKLRMN